MRAKLTEATIVIVSIGLATFLYTACQSQSGEGGSTGAGGSGSGGTEQVSRKNGFTSKTSYQVFVTAFGASRAEAEASGLTEARRKAFNLLRKRHERKGARLTGSGKRELRRIIARHGRIVKLVQEPNGSWSVVLRIEKEGLKGLLRQLK